MNPLVDVWAKQVGLGRAALRAALVAALPRPCHAVPYGTDLVGIAFQALRAWLRSLSPYGTQFPP
jgi:hypothetical protein